MVLVKTNQEGPLLWGTSADQETCVAAGATEVARGQNGRAVRPERAPESGAVVRREFGPVW